MNVGIIGAGNVGRALGSSFGRAGHNVTITARDYENAQTAAKETGAQALSSAQEVAQSADVVVLAVPFASVDDVLGKTAEFLGGKTVIDVTNPLNDEYSGLVTGERSAAESVQERAPAARVVKAFNTVLAGNQVEPVVDGLALDGFVAGDDDNAKRTALSLVESIGLRPVDVGPLGMARALEHMAFLNISIQLRNNGSWQSGWKLIGPVP